MRISKKLFLMILFFLGYSNYYAATGTETLDNVVKVMSIVVVALVLFTLWLALVYSEKNDNDGSAFKALLYKASRLLDNSVPVEEEQKIMLDHSYDGIKELDNRVPPWFNFLFYGTILIAVVYLINYHILGSGNIMEEEYLAEMNQAQLERTILIKSGAFLNEETVTQLSDPGALNAGKEIYMKNCAACHGNKGEGMVGPNLTDQYWIHGGSIKDIFKTIKYGVPSKGMISWQSQLSPNNIQEVASYILSLQGTNPPSAKGPEGELYKPKENAKK